MNTERNELHAAFLAVRQVLAKLQDIADDPADERKAPAEAKFHLLDLSEVLEMWSKRPSPVINRHQREEVGRQITTLHRLFTRNGFETDGLHELLTRAERVIDAAQPQQEAQPARRMQTKGRVMA